MLSKKAIQYLVLVVMVAGLLLTSVSADEDNPVVKPTETGATTPDVNLSQGDNAEGRPAIYFPEEIHNFGDVSQATTLVHTFIVMNKGDAPLKLISARAS